MKTDRLEQAIHDAVAATAAPEESRLAAILARLEQVPASRPAPRRSAWPWLLLAAAGAAAAGGGYWYMQLVATRTQPADAGDSQSVIEAPASTVPASPPSTPPGMAGDGGEPQRNNTIIYRQ